MRAALFVAELRAATPARASLSPVLRNSRRTLPPAHHCSTDAVTPARASLSGAAALSDFKGHGVPDRGGYSTVTKTRPSFTKVGFVFTSASGWSVLPVRTSYRQPCQGHITSWPSSTPSAS